MEPATALAAAFAATAEEAAARFAAATSSAAVEELRIAYLGRSGRLKELQEGFTAAPGEAKRTLGPALNACKEAVKQAWEAAAARLAAGTSDSPIDVTLPMPARRPGTIHPVSQVALEVERIFSSMGYEIVDGPHVELDEFNFGRLNIPADHPARDSQDTFWLVHPSGEPRLLRTQTSAVQARLYQRIGQGLAKPPLRQVVVGRVFRYEAVDATHDNTFTQVEGIVLDRDITVANLVATLRTTLVALLKREDVEIRLRPSFFPFVEPGFEVDVRLTKADPSSRLSRWVELLGCGMIHPRVLELGSQGLSEYTGFAFGIGLERLTMMRHGIADIRVFNGADLRSLHQFG